MLRTLRIIVAALALLPVAALAQPIPGAPGPGPVPGAVLNAVQNWTALQNFNSGWSITSALPGPILNRTAGTGWKSAINFEHGGSLVYTVGVDVALTSAHDFFFDDGTNLDMTVGAAGVNMYMP